MRAHKGAISAVSRFASSLARFAAQPSANAAATSACARHCAQSAASPAPASASRLSFERGVRTRPKLPVVLTAEVEGLGFAGDVVKVPAGFARNKLIPQKVALPAIPKFLRQVRLAKEQGGAQGAGGAQGGALGGAQGGAQGGGAQEIAPRAAAAAAEGGASVVMGGDAGRGEEEEGAVVTMEERVNEAQEIARRLDSQRLSIRAVTPKRANELHQPITQRHIISEVRRQFGIQLSEANVPLPVPLSSIGDFEVPLRFPPSVALPGEREQIQLAVHVRRK
ncbi:hypothetical protein CLOM_g21447 [Closterium sp. NIES-68]|nr:hypothetical protein CLOM_g21447 [Closterium sp. NIES-68]GJP60881.1 hypothetical protein CLOP_g18095 [Closterium sp. NIES-67]